MVTSIISVSLPVELLQFCKKCNISPSFLLQNAIIERMKYESGEILDSNASLSAKITRLTDHIEKYSEFLEKRGLMNDFLSQTATQ